jgi:Pyruvate kinase, barrel domain
MPTPPTPRHSPPSPSGFSPLVGLGTDFVQQRRTKIIATIGPACSTPEVIGAMMDAGLNCARLNFS